MKKRARLRTRLAVGVVLVAAILSAFVWWYRQGRYTLSASREAPGIQVTLISPAGGDEASLGDQVPVVVRTFSPTGVSSVELLIDGVSAGAVKEPGRLTSWTWQAFIPGLHTFVASATSPDGQTAESQPLQLFVIKSRDQMRVAASDGATLLEMGREFGMAPFDMAAANPQLDPLISRHGGQPVNVPAVASLRQTEGPSSTGGTAEGAFPMIITWDLRLTKAMDRSYCYVGDGRGGWQREPRSTAQFFETQEARFMQPFREVPALPLTLAAECWSWSGGVLQSLGKGSAALAAGEPNQDLIIFGQDFQLSGTQRMTSGEQSSAQDPEEIPAPFELGEPANAAECTRHGGNSSICDAALNALFKPEMVLKWAWRPVSRAGAFNEIDGYRVYEMDAFSGGLRLLIETHGAATRAVAVPRPIDARCFGVSAYARDARGGSLLESELIEYCPGPSGETQQLTVAPSAWITSGGQWVQDFACESAGSDDIYEARNQSAGFGAQPGEVLVGSYVVKQSGRCYREGDYAAGLEFGELPVPAGAAIQKAVLSFATDAIEYEVSGTALPTPPASCAAELGIAKQDWRILDIGNHSSGTWLSDPAYYEPYSSITGWANSSVDVTAMVDGWIANPETNHGVVLAPSITHAPSGDGSGRCLSWVSDAELTIDYLAP